MKKYFLSLGLIMAAMLTLTNCTEQIDAPVEPAKVPFEIIASTVETKTAAGDNLSTVWTEGDALNVFHVFAGNEGYQNDGMFELTGDNTFKGELSGTFEDEDCYNWYALYPYNKNVTTPANTGDKGYVTVGSGASASQIQTGNNSMSHIAGPNYPLAGVAEDVEYYAGDPLEINMSHLSSLLEVVVKNNTGKELTVESVSFTGTEDVIGTYYIDFTGVAPVFTKSGDKFVANVAKLDVKAGEAIPDGETATFYLAIKPFTATGEISLAVNNIAKPKTVDNVTFAPGTIKTLNYTMKASDFLETSDIADAIEVEDDDIVQIEGLVIARYDKGYLVQDETGIMLVYTSTTPDAEVGDKVNVTGTKTTYDGFAQINTPTVKVLSKNNTVTHPAPTVLDGAALDAQLTAESVSYIQFTGKLSISSGKYYNVTVAGASTAKGSISYPESSMGLSDMNGKTIKVSGYYIGASSSRYVNVMAVAVEEIPAVADPVITCTEDGEVEITCETEDATIYYTLDGTDPSASNGTAYTGKFSVASGTTIKAVGVKAEYANSAFVSYTYTKVSQNAVTVVLSAAERPCDNFPNTSTGVTTTTTYTIGGYEWTFSPSNGNKFSWYESQKYILWGKQGGYILLPAVEGKKLTKVTILTGKGASTNVKVGVFNAEGTAAVTGGDAIQLDAQDAEFSWNLSETEENTHYQLRVTSAHNAQLQTLTCIYE